MIRAILVLISLTALSGTAAASVPLFGQVSCAVVRFYVAKYSESTAENWARSHGASAADIETARRCLHGASVRTASSVARSQVNARLTGQERAQPEPAQQEPAEQSAKPELQPVAAVQVRRDEPEQERHAAEAGDGSSGSNNASEDRTAPAVSQEMKDPPARPDGTASPLRRHAARGHHPVRTRMASHSRWIKRFWAHLTWPRQFRIAFLHPRTSRQ
jgi:hypothetical protein